MNRIQPVAPTSPQGFARSKTYGKLPLRFDPQSGSGRSTIGYNTATAATVTVGGKPAIINGVQSPSTSLITVQQ
jgi:hypothetical protein